MAILWLGAAAVSVSVMQGKLLEVYDESLRQSALGLLPLAIHEFQEGTTARPSSSSADANIPIEMGSKKSTAPSSMTRASPT
jgi:hypothetical protein